MSLKEYISRTASEWIGGIKRLISFPYGPKTTPEDDYQLINKLYADGMVTSLSVSISNALSSISASLGGISTFLTSEVIWSSTCNRPVVSVSADPAPTANDVWIDINRSVEVSWYFTSASTQAMIEPIHFGICDATTVICFSDIRTNHQQPVLRSDQPF